MPTSGASPASAAYASATGTAYAASVTPATPSARSDAAVHGRAAARTRGVRFERDSVVLRGDIAGRSARRRAARTSDHEPAAAFLPFGAATTACAYRRDVARRHSRERASSPQGSSLGHAHRRDPSSDLVKGDRCGKTVYQSSARAVADDLRHVVASLIVGGGAGNLDVVAQHMGTSVRTLQRRLRAVGVTYSEVVQQARCAAAEWM